MPDRSLGFFRRMHSHFRANKVCLARARAGRVPKTSGLGLEEAGVKMGSKGQVRSRLCACVVVDAVMSGVSGQPTGQTPCSDTAIRRSIACIYTLLFAIAPGMLYTSTIVHRSAAATTLAGFCPTGICSAPDVEDAWMTCRMVDVRPPPHCPPYTTVPSYACKVITPNASTRLHTHAHAAGAGGRVLPHQRAVHLGRG